MNFQESLILTTIMYTHSDKSIKMAYNSIVLDDISWEDFSL